MKSRIGWSCACWILFLSAASAARAGLPQNFVVDPVHLGLALPSNMAFSPDGRIFYNELKTGRVRVIKNGQLLPQPFLSLNIYNSGERGLLGIALVPGFPENPWVYLYATVRVPLPEPHPENQLIRVRAEGDVGAQPEVLLSLPTNQQFHIHNGGELVFGPDGKLYMTVGDAFMSGKAQALDFLGGKVLRLELDGTGAAGNPFPGDATRARIWSRGHRNHFGMGFDWRTGNLFQTENGPTVGDEINHILPGKNYGWPTCEGPCDPPQAGLTQPLYAYPQTIAPTGLAVLDGNRYPQPFVGDVIYGDYNFGRLRRLDLDPNDQDTVLAVDERFFELESLIPQDDPQEHRLGVLDVQIGPDGFLWFAVADFFDLDTPNLAGIYRLRYTLPVSQVVPAAGWFFALLAGLTVLLVRGMRASAAKEQRAERTCNPPGAAS